MIRALLAVLLLCGFTQDQKVSLQDAGVVRVQYVDTSHWAISHANEAAKAIRTADGQKWILINVDADQTDFESWFLHEMAHHIAWVRHGEDIAPHWPEFRRICRQLIKHRTKYFCEGH